MGHSRFGIYYYYKRENPLQLTTLCFVRQSYFLIRYENEFNKGLQPIANKHYFRGAYYIIYYILWNGLFGLVRIYSIQLPGFSLKKRELEYPGYLYLGLILEKVRRKLFSLLDISNIESLATRVFEFKKFRRRKRRKATPNKA